MMLSSKQAGNSCTDVKPRFAWNDEDISVGFACSHGTVIWLSMTPTEARDFVIELGRITAEVLGVIEEEDEE